MCAKHKKKVIRVLKTKRLSVINKDRPLWWKKVETTILAWPGIQSTLEASAVKQNKQLEEICTANKKARIC